MGVHPLKVLPHLDSAVTLTPGPSPASGRGVTLSQDSCLSLTDRWNATDPGRHSGLRGLLDQPWILSAGLLPSLTERRNVTDLGRRSKLLARRGQPLTHRYALTDFGLRAALFSTRSYARLIRPGLALVTPDAMLGDSLLRRSFQQLERAMVTWCDAAKIAA